jgi:hypothetical protein
VLALKPRHRVMIEQAAIRLPTEKQSAFFDRATGELQRRQFCSTGGLTDSDIADAIERTLRGLQYSESTFP